MPWVYLDDHWDEHPKMLAAYEADHRTPTLFHASLAYCRRNNTDGLVPGPKVRGLLGWSAKAQRALITFDLWEAIEGSAAVVIHDWSQWNRTTEERSASARNAAQVRWKRAKEK